MKRKATLGAAMVLCVGWVTLDSPAQYVGPKEGRVVTVEEVKAMPDDAVATVEGYIVQQLRGEDYLFRDDTGELRVDIDDDLWLGREVGAETLVRLTGEVDVEYRAGERFGVELEVHHLKVVPPGGE